MAQVNKKERIITLAKEWKSIDEIRIKSEASLGYIKTVIGKAREEGELPQPLLIKGLDTFDITNETVWAQDVKEEMSKLEKGEIQEIVVEATSKWWLDQIINEKSGLQEIFNTLVMLYGKNQEGMTGWWADFSKQKGIDPALYNMQYKDNKVTIKKHIEEKTL